MPFKVSYKTGVDPADWPKCKSTLLELRGTSFNFCEKYDLPCRVSMIIGLAAHSTVKIHLEGRAYDLSTREWLNIHIWNYLCVVNVEHAEKIGAFSKGDGRARAAIFETSKQAFYNNAPDDVRPYIKLRTDDVKDHLHNQVRR